MKVRLVTPGIAAVTVLSRTLSAMLGRLFTNRQYERLKFAARCFDPWIAFREGPRRCAARNNRRISK